MKEITKVFNFEQIGIGGLAKEFEEIFRVAFASRRRSAEYLEKYGIKHVKGMLLYGPPGTGKTLIARKLASVLNAEECKVVNGPELFDKYVGETEKKIRELFSKAEEDEKKHGDNSGLHVIIFDEIDSICRARGSINSGTSVNDNAVNQLLTKIDGVDSLNNILLIGMTNRKDLLDEAILRPGRLELHVPIELPNMKGRLEIFQIHTKQMALNNLLEKDVNLEKLAKLTENYTGAEIETLVKRACSYVLTTEIGAEDNQEELNTYKKVTMDYFMNAFKEIEPKFGTDKFLDKFAQSELINYGPRFEAIHSELTKNLDVLKNSKTSLLSILLEGEMGVGKTAIACHIAKNSGIPFVKVISPETIVGLMETGKTSTISRIFEDAYKSPVAIIVLDDLEELVEYVRVGPRFSMLILSTLRVYIKRLPPQGKKLFIIGTTSLAERLRDLDLTRAFNKKVTIPKLSNKEEIEKVLDVYNVKGEHKNKIASNVTNIPVKYLSYIVQKTQERNNGVVDVQTFSEEYEDYCRQVDSEY